MAKLEEILKSKGYTQDEMDLMKPMLENAAFRAKLESTFDGYEGDVSKYKTESEGWATWYENKAMPTLDKHLKDAADATARADAAEGRLKFFRDRGLAQLAGEPPPEEKKELVEAAFDPRKHKLVTEDDIGRLADLEGEAIATASDLSIEFQELFGKSLLSYTGQDGSRGMRALRKEAVAARKNLYDHVSEKFGFNARRAEIAAENAKKHDDGIRADERAKLIAEFGQPGAGAPRPSNSPFSTQRTEARGGKQPWELNENELTANRVQKAYEKTLQ
jgi:hypothetical protein